MSKTGPRYPVYIPSKGRWDNPLTATRLREMGVEFKVVVEPQEAREYVSRLGAGAVLELPFGELGEGSIPARNWIWEHAKKHGHARHWLIDDNHWRFYRLSMNAEIPVYTGAVFRAAEAFADRYEKVAFAGFQDEKFILEREPKRPYVLNTRIYSVTLINTALPYRWRGRYNEDTDLCLRALKDGWCTIQFNAFLGKKHATASGAGRAGMKGGNTDNVYNTGDHRRAFAESLKAQHPDVVEVVWKYGRWHHQVDYSPFKGNKLKLKPGITPTGTNDEYGMRLVRVDSGQASGETV